jgi:hypothetical protein
VNDLERDLRQLLSDDAEHVPTPASAPEGLRRRARLGQAAFAAFTGIVVVGIAALGVWALGSLPSRDAAVPAVQPTTTQTMNGITIAFPGAWYLIDPDQAGLNSSKPTRDLPRLVLALSPQAPTDLIACPGIVEGQQPTFLMTVQEVPRALEGDASAPWPAALEPMDLGGSTGSACYPGWEFLVAGWTAEGRTFGAAVGLSPEVSEQDREALLAAFDSMTFAPADQAPTSVVLTTGTTGGEDWELIASSGPEGLSLSIQAESFGAGGSIHKPASEALGLVTHVFGSGDQAKRLVWGTVPATAVRIDGIDAASNRTEIPVIDIPDEIDARANAFVIEIPVDGTVAIEAFDVTGAVVARGRSDPEPAEPVPSVVGLEDGRHFGFIRSVDVAGRRVDFDLAYWLSGEEANQAYQEATGLTGPVPNDHFVVNDNPKLRALPLSPDLRLRLLDWNHCCEAFFDGDLALFAQAIETQGDVVDGDLRYSGQSQWWITVEDGVVTEIEEQYSP